MVPGVPEPRGSWLPPASRGRPPSCLAKWPWQGFPARLRIGENSQITGQFQRRPTRLKEVLHIVAADGTVILGGAETAFGLPALAIAETQPVRRFCKLKLAGIAQSETDGPDVDFCPVTSASQMGKF